MFGRLMKKLLIIFIFCSFNLFPQYTSNDSLLIYTTFTKQFDKFIINDYLKSGDNQKINAALLTIANSRDKHYIQSILDLSFKENYSKISFVLGQLGESEKASQYLTTKFLTSSDLLEKKACLVALGNTVDSVEAAKIIDNYFETDGGEYDGISKFILNLKNRGVSVENDIRVFKNELFNYKNSSTRIEEAIYVISRLNLSEKLKSTIYELMLNPNASDMFFQYSLNGFNRIKFFPNDFELMQKLISHKNPVVRTEVAKSAIYFPFTNINQLKEYCTLLNDKNPNVSVQASMALKNIKLSDDVDLSEVKTFLKQYLYRSDWSKYHYSEFVKSFIQLFPLEGEMIKVNFIERMSDELNLQFRIKQYDYSQKIENPLLDFYYHSEEKIKVEFWESITSSQLKNLLEFSEDFFWSELNNGTGAIVGTIISKFDEAIFNQYRTKVNSTFLYLVNINLHNPDFVEALITIQEKAKNFSEELHEIIQELFSYSELYSIKSRVNKAGSIRADNYFAVLYNNAFKYKIARIITSKGEVVIRFLPNIAPVSVGNFVYLANLSFFNNVSFHRVVPGFVVQAGDKSSTGWYGAGYEINSELSDLNYSEGMVGMASAGKDTEGSQLFIMQGEHPHLNGNYTIWAEVVSGLSVVQSIEQEDRILKIILE